MKFRNYGEKLEQLRQLRGGRCEHIYDSGRRCNSTIKLEFAHIKMTTLIGRGRGQSRRYYDIKKFPDCYKLMCRTHHKQYDFRKL